MHIDHGTLNFMLPAEAEIIYHTVAVAVGSPLLLEFHAARGDHHTVAVAVGSPLLLGELVSSQQQQQYACVER